MSVRRWRRTGFTLIEVIVALTVSAIVLVGARSVLDAISTQAARGERTDEVHAMTVNGERVLRELVLDARSGQEASATFGGDAESMTWDTWCRVPAGWKERCRTTVAVIPNERDGGFSLIATGPFDIGVTLVRTDDRPLLVYLDDPMYGGHWMRSWGPATVRPIAIGVLSEQDTIILPTGRPLR